MRPDRAKVYAQGQDVGLGSKKASDLIADDVTITFDGVDATVTGTIKYVDDFTAFDTGNPENQKGNFFPLLLSDAFEGEAITVQRTGGTAKTVQDRTWILRLPSKDAVWSFKAQGREFMRLSFAKATLAGAKV